MRRLKQGEAIIDYIERRIFMNYSIQRSFLRSLCTIDGVNKILMVKLSKKGFILY